ncbi:rhodanese-like domain-containing protein [Desulfovibrio psychrotolerans]|uniref:Sulfurtransferase n=1 Tax=Desulfovibrio psychrotolerans TaxID=415242 RepID=A0A7J0BQ90_9BACT|nr:rhodanese-like domain-containing protein [Desulfovibrio psychrotolerans]GFM35342.1 sulfurtransferase [Desulfovibrio psychrotolerans]
MQRIVVVSSGLAGAKAAARIKRFAPEVEVNLVIPGGEERATGGSGPFARITAARQVSETMMEARQVGVIKARNVQIDFAQKVVTVQASRGLIQIRFNQVVLEVDASPRLPRALHSAENVVPWPFEDGGMLDAWIAETAPEKAVIVGGATSLGLLAPLLEAGLNVTWVRTSDAGFDAYMWEAMDRMAGAGNGRLTVEDWSAVRLESLMPVLSESGALQAVQDGRGGVVEGDVFFWTEPQRALHPIIAEQGVELDASGLIAVDEHFHCGPDGLYIIGSGVALPRLPLQVPGQASGQPLGQAVPAIASGDEAVLASARVVANHLAGFVSENGSWGGCAGTLRFSGAGVLACKVGLTHKEAVEAGFEPEFGLLKSSPGLASEQGDPVVVKLLCDKHSHAILGAQIVAKEGCQWADSIANGVVTALAASMMVERLATLDFAGGGGELLVRAAAVLSNKLLYRVYGVSAAELLASKEAGANFFMLDLRDNIAWKNGHIPDSYNIPFTQLKKRLQDEVPRFTPIVLISRTSDAAYSVACHLRGLGASDLYVLDGGMEMWPFAVAKG